jgi:CDP-diacylglycerol---glycerol-3-phosphate 3-phosphatidyltransferase
MKIRFFWQMNIAHYFTFLRIFIIPFFPIIYLYPGWFGISIGAMPYFLLGILLICELTDVVDGFLARKKNQVSDLGKIIDPMADTITHISVFFTFTQGMVSIPLLLVFILLYRELAISALRTLCALKGYALAARKSGKIKAISQAVVCFLIVILMIPYTMGLISLELLQCVSLLSLSLIALYTIVTLVDYFYANWGYIKKLVN